MKFRSFNCRYLLPIIFALSFITISCEEGLTEPHLEVFTTDNIVKLQAAADKIMRTYPTPGLLAYIGVEGEGELYITRGVGNITTNELMNVNNNFRIASVTKTFTTEAVLILADEGKIDLNKSITFYLPELNIPSGDKITIRMLGNMTSGFVDCLNDSAINVSYIDSQGSMRFTPESLVAAAFKYPLKFTPGTRYDYCNTNTILLGLVIKKVTGESVSQVLEEKIFQPLGLTHTFWPESNYLPYPYHHAYTRALGTLTDVTYWSNSIGDAAGILVSNISDLIIWAKELNERNLLSANMKAERYAWIDGSSPGSYYGFGIERMGNWVGHPGLIMGYNNQVFYHAGKKITIIVTTNSEEGQPAFVAFAEFAKILTP
ncbi:MAG: beta-lactamase family protein [Bacteroidetes bacterium]|nr:beta-lactamase family protein [Bacteroidota bacterium]